MNTISPNGCPLTDSVTISIYKENTSTSGDTIICPGDSTQIFAFGGVSYSWTPTSSINNSLISNPISFPISTTKYLVNITTPMGCIKKDSVQIRMDSNILVPKINNDTTICNGYRILLQASGGTNYSWKPTYLVTNPLSPSTLAFPTLTTNFIVEISNYCYRYTDTVEVTVINPSTSIIPNDTICKGDSILVSASGGLHYLWKNDVSILTGLGFSSIYTNPSIPTEYTVFITDTNGCKDTNSVLIDIYPEPKIDAGKDVIIELGGNTIFNPKGDKGSIIWTPSYSLNCSTCRNPQAFPDKNTVYTIYLTDKNGCKTSDSLLVRIGGVLYLPNTFTPEGDGYNERFMASGVNITKFNLKIFNRWGELIYESNDINVGWDGTFKGKKCKIDSYVWKVTYSHLTEQTNFKMGHVNLIR